MRATRYWYIPIHVTPSSAEQLEQVHCFLGVSRSASVVCAYLVATEGLIPADSIAYVQSKRGIVAPNTGFRRQLEVYGAGFVGMKAKGKSIFKTRDRIKVLKANTSMTAVNFAF